MKDAKRARHNKRKKKQQAINQSNQIKSNQTKPNQIKSINQSIKPNKQTNKPTSKQAKQSKTKPTSKPNPNPNQTNKQTKKGRTNENQTKKKKQSKQTHKKTHTQKKNNRKNQAMTWVFKHFFSLPPKKTARSMFPLTASNQVNASTQPTISGWNSWIPIRIPSLKTRRKRRGNGWFL